MDPDPQRLNVDCTTSLTRYRISTPRVNRIFEHVATSLQLPVSYVSLRFVGSSAIARLNKDHREKASDTDVLSFPQNEWSEPLLSASHKKSSASRQNRQAKSLTKLQKFSPIVHWGDLVLCPDVAKRNAKDIGQSLDREVCFLLVHGMLHLLGHDHMKDSEAEVMYEQQRLIMAGLDKVKKGQAPAWKNLVRSVRGDA